MADTGWNNGNWDVFEQWMNGNFPIGRSNIDFSWVKDMVDEVVNGALDPAVTPSVRPSGSKASKPQRRRLPFKLFQTHNHVIVRFLIRDEDQARQIRVFAGVSRLRLEGFPGNGVQLVELPALVDPRSCLSLYKDKVLQVKLQKRRTNDRFYEAFVRYE